MTQLYRKTLSARTWRIAALFLALRIIVPISSPQAFAQSPLQVQVIVQPLQSPYLSDYERSPGALLLTITNTSMQDVRFKVGGTLKLLRQNRIVASVKLPQAREQSVNAGSTLTLQATELLDRSWLDFSAQDRDNALRSGRIPEGDYELCLQVVDAQNTARLLTAPIPCRQYRTQTPDAPRLLSPANNQAVLQTYPAFSWTPTFFVSGRTAAYVLTVCKILKGQTPRQALEGNVPLVKETNIQGTSYTYPATAEQFEQITDAVGYVWQVQAVDENGTPVGENNGKSELFTFLPPKAASTNALSNTTSAPSSSTTPDATQSVLPAVTVSGTVQVQIGTGKFPAKGFNVRLQAASEANATVSAVETNASGGFILRSITAKPDTYSLRITGRGVEKIVPIGVMNVRESKDNVAVTVELPSYQATLTIVNTEGKPVAGARVKISRASSAFAVQGEPALNLSVTSDGAGVATLNNLLLSGNVQDFYIAEIQADGYKTQKIYLQSRTTGVVSERVRLEREGLRVFGVVRRGTEAVANAAVHLVSSGKTLFQSISDNDGAFTIDAPASLIAGLSAEAKANLSVYAVRGELRGESVLLRSAGVNTGSVEANPTLPQGATTLTGTVFVLANGRKTLLASASVRDVATGSSTTTDAQGAFSLNASGSKAVVMVSRPGFEDKETTIDGLSPQSREIALTPLGNWLQVTVLDAKTTKPIPNANIVLIDNAGRATSDAQGMATLRGFPQYVRTMSIYASGYGVETVDFMPSSGFFAEPVVVRLSPGGSVSGKVTDEANKPVAQAVVSLAGYENVLEVKTNVDGAFRLDFIPSGEVRIVARAQGFLTARQEINIVAEKPQQTTLVLKKQPTTTNSASSITQLAGFEASIDAVREEGENLVISGVLTNLKPSKLFASLVQTVNFQEVRVSKASAASGNALPVAGKFSLVERELAMKFADEFPVKAKNASIDAGLEIVLENPTDKQGVLKGSVQWQFAEYVGDVAAGARANVEEVGILVAKPILGKDGSEPSFYEEHSLFSNNAELLQTSEESEYKAACQQVPSITISGVTLALVCDNFSIDVANRRASFGALATLPENPLGIDTLRVNPVVMSKAWGFQSANISFTPALSIPLATSGWRMNLTSINIASNGVQLGGSITVSVAPSIPVNGIAFSNLGVSVGAASGGSFTLSPNEFDVYGITKITAPTLAITFAGDSVMVRAAGGRMNLADAGWGLTIPTFQFTRRLDSLRRKPNLPAFNAPNVNARPNNLRRPGFPLNGGKLGASLLRIVSVELSGIDFNEQNELVIDGGVAFQFPSLQVQAGNFIFGKNKFVVGKFGFRLDNGALNAGMNIEFTPANRTASPPTNARFRGDATVEIKKGGDVFIGLAAAVMYESSQVWSVDFVANIPPIQLVPAPPPGVPIYLSGFGGGFERSNSDYRLSLQCTLQNAPSKPAPMDVTLGVTVWTTGSITGTALMNVIGEKLGDGRITMDVVKRDATGTINLGLSKGGVTATGSVNFGVYTSRKGDYFVDANTQLNVAGLMTANGRFYYGVETRTVIDTARIKLISMPAIPNAPAPIQQDLQQIGAMLTNMDRIDDNYEYKRTLPYSGSGQLQDAAYRWKARPFTDNKPLGEYTLDRVDEVLRALPAKTASKQALTEEELTTIPRATLQSTVETKPPFLQTLNGIPPVQGIVLPADFRTIDIPAGYNWLAMIYGDGFYTTNLLNAPPQNNATAILEYDKEYRSAVTRLIGMFRSKSGNNSSLDWQTFRRGRRIYSEVVGRIANVFWTAGISPRDIKTRDSLITKSRDVKDGKMILSVNANIANQNKSFNIGALGSVAFYGRGDGQFYLETSKDFKNGSGSLTFFGATGFSVKVVKITISGDALLNGQFDLQYTPTLCAFNGTIQAQLNAQATADGCCDSCTPSCNDYCTRFIYASVRACIGVNANMGYNNKKFSFDIARR